MERAPAQIVLRALHASGYHVTASALRNWTHRGHITRGPGGYCLREIVAYLDGRRQLDGA